MTELAITPPTRKQELALRYIKALDVPAQMLNAMSSMQDFPPFNGDKAMFLASVEAVSEGLKLEQAEMVEATERIYSEAELEVLAEQAENPHYKSAMAKSGLLAEALHGAMARIFSRAGVPMIGMEQP